jgi:uncharacterized repeat protein (TIGR03806 family)
VLPYDVVSPLWSDGADKERWFAIPDGTSIHADSDGDWDLPVGSVVLKTFRVGGQPVETRMLVRHDDGDWAGYTYEWADDGSDAALLVSSESKTVANVGSWYFPSRSDCLRCHTAAAGRTLGLETAQLDRDIEYAPGRRANQVETLTHLRMLDGLPAGARPPALPAPSSNAAPLAARARSYLHANCSFCHRPDGGGGGDLDFRYSASWPATGACNAVPTLGTFGLTDARVFAPTDPARSVLSHRMHALDVARMPPLATGVVDTAGVDLIDEWIASTLSCECCTPAVAP